MLTNHDLKMFIHVFFTFCVFFIQEIQCCGSGMLIPDPIFFHPGSASKIKYFNPKLFQSSRKYNPGCLSRILIMIVYPSRIQETKRHRIPDPDPKQSRRRTLTFNILLQVFHHKLNGGSATKSSFRSYLSVA
jgi:hypothetical protein